MTQRVGVGMVVNDLELAYKKVADKVVLLNDFDSTDENQKSIIDRFLKTEIEDNVIDSTPTCNCKERPLRGHRYKGKRCNICYSTVESPLGREIASELWIRVPEGIDAFISPRIYQLLSATFDNISSFRGIRYLIDPEYKWTINKTKDRARHIEKFIAAFSAVGWERSLNHFVRNFELALNILTYQTAAVRFYKPTRQQNADGSVTQEEIVSFFLANQQKIFTRYLPVVSRCILVTERGSSADNRRYVMDCVSLSLDAVNTLHSLDSLGSLATDRVKNRRILTVMDQLIGFIIKFTADILIKKTGLLRRQINGCRVEYSSRLVITSITGAHDLNLIHASWAASVNMFSKHITAILMHRYGWSPVQIDNHLYTHMKTFCPIINDIFDIIFKESSTPGFIPVMLNRNPTLKLGATQGVGISYINRNPKVNAFAVSPLLMPEPNGDYDGDELNLVMCLDEREYLCSSRLKPHLTVPSVDCVYAVSGGAGSLPKQTIRNTTNMIHSGES